MNMDGDAQSHYRLGFVFEKKGLPINATAAYQWALECDPELKWARYNLASIYARRGEYGRAGAVYRDFIRRYPGESRAKMALGNIHLQTRRYAEAIALYHFGHGHTNGDTIVVFRSLGVAHTGDLFAWKGVPYIDVNNGGSGVSYPKTLLAAADGISGIDMVIPGHSPVMTWADFREFGEFNRDFLAAVQREKAAGRTAADAAENLNLPARYANYAMSRGSLTSAEMNTTKIYDELD